MGHELFRFWVITLELPIECLPGGMYTSMSSMANQDMKMKKAIMVNTPPMGVLYDGLFL